MKKSIVISLIMVVTFGFLLVALAAPVIAAPQAQLTPFPTPTPGPDGRIVYIVQTGDSLWRIAAVAGITIDELRSLNNLGVDAVISPGQQLLLGLGGPSAGLPTQGPPPTATSELPTPTPGMGTGTLCVLLFEDANGDALRQEEELSLPGGAISVNDLTGAVNITAETPSGGISNALFPDPDNIAPPSIGMIKSGDWPSTVPDKLVAEGRFGVFPVESVESARKAFEAMILRSAPTDGWLQQHPSVVEWRKVLQVAPDPRQLARVGPQQTAAGALAGNRQREPLGLGHRLHQGPPHAPAGTGDRDSYFSHLLSPGRWLTRVTPAVTLFA